MTPHFNCALNILLSGNWKILSFLLQKYKTEIFKRDQLVSGARNSPKGSAYFRASEVPKKGTFLAPGLENLYVKLIFFRIEMNGSQLYYFI